MTKTMFNNVYTEKYLNDLIDATYNISFAVYKKYTWGQRLGITLEEYSQEAVMEILKLFRNRFITPPLPNYTSTNLKTYVYAILDGVFSRRLQSLVFREQNKTPLLLENLVQSYSYGDETENHTLERLMGSCNDLTPEELDKLSSGQDILQKLTKEFSPIKYNTKKHIYTNENGKHLSPYVLANHIIGDLSQQDIAEIYGVDTKVVTSRLTFIYNKYNQVFKKLIKLIDNLDSDERALVLKYLSQRL